MAALHHYATQGYHLIENGDIEDYWLRGGSTYGVIYDIASGLPAPYLDKAFNEAQVLAATKFHLYAIVDQNKPLYTLIKSGFYDQNRYSRTVGNHDDVYSHPKMVEALRRGAADYLVTPVDLARIRKVLANVSRTRELKQLAKRAAASRTSAARRSTRS